jgi:hypothetical protein
MSNSRKNGTYRTTKNTIPNKKGVSLLNAVLNECIEYDGFYIHKDILSQYKLAKEKKIACAYSYCETGWLKQNELRAKEGQASTGNVKGRVKGREGISKKIILDVLIDNSFLKKNEDQRFNKFRHTTLNKIIVVDEKNISTKEMVEYFSIDSFLNLREERKEDLQYFIGNKELILKKYEIYKHQLQCIDKMILSIDDGYCDFGMFMLPRSGKNITFLHYIKTQIDNKVFKKSGNYLVISADPKIFPSMICDNKDYFGYNLIDIANDRNFIPSKTKPNLFIVSKQLLDNKRNNNLLTTISKLKFEVKFIDECHDSTKTEKFDELNKKLNAKFAIHASGTAFFELIDIKFDSNNTFVYSYNDYATDGNTPLLEYYQFKIKNYELLSNKDENHSWKKYYSTDNKGKLIYEGEVVEDWGNILNVNRKSTYGTYSPFKRFDIQHTLCLMPPTTSGIKATVKVLNQKYGATHLFIAATDGLYKSIDDIKKIIDTESKGKGRKTITLTCGTFTQGTSVPEWHVLLMSDTESPLLWVQTMFRSLTKDKLGKGGSNTKEFGYVCDFSPLRDIAYRFDDWARKEAKLKGVSNPKDYLKSLIHNANLMQPNGDVEFIKIPMDTILGYITEPMYKAKSLQKNVYEFIDIELFKDNALSTFAKYAEKMQGISQRIGNADFTKGKLMHRIGEMGIRSKKKKAEIQYAIEQAGILLARLVKFPIFNYANTVEEILKLDDAIFEAGTDGFKKQHLELLINKCGLDIQSINYKL